MTKADIRTLCIQCRGGGAEIRYWAHTEGRGRGIPVDCRYCHGYGHVDAVTGPGVPKEVRARYQEFPSG